MTQAEYLQQFALFQQQSRDDGRFSVVEACHPILDDDKPAHDEKDFSFDYWAHCSWAARKIAARKPKFHFDFGSYVYFPGIVSAFVGHLFYWDIRGLPSTFENLQSLREDMRKLSIPDNEIDSISCLHVLEHIGLGRYGDTLDAQGDLKAAKELARILAPGGQLILVTPMNEVPRVTFNSDRYYSMAMVKEMFAPLSLKEFQLIHGGRITDRLPPKGEHYTGLMVWTK